MNGLYPSAPAETNCIHLPGDIDPALHSAKRTECPDHQTCPEPKCQRMAGAVSAQEACMEIRPFNHHQGLGDARSGANTCEQRKQTRQQNETLSGNARRRWSFRNTRSLKSGVAEPSWWFGRIAVKKCRFQQRRRSCRSIGELLAAERAMARGAALPCALRQQAQHHEHPAPALHTPSFSAAKLGEFAVWHRERTASYMHTHYHTGSAPSLDTGVSRMPDMIFLPRIFGLSSYFFFLSFFVEKKQHRHDEPRLLWRSCVFQRESGAKK